MSSALGHDGPVIFMEPKLLSEEWLEFLGSGGRDTVTFDVPVEGAFGPVPDPPHTTPIGRAVVRREGNGVTIVSVAVGVHRALEAAAKLDTSGVSCEVIDLRSLRPLDTATVVESVTKTGRLLVVDEDYREFGLSGEMASVCLEAGLSPRFARVCVEDTLPYARPLEDEALPNVDRIVAAAKSLADA
jgi:pyruvate dehydrogenase E1 component beta subunit